MTDFLSSALGKHHQKPEPIPILLAGSPFPSRWAGSWGLKREDGTSESMAAYKTRLSTKIMQVSQDFLLLKCAYLTHSYIALH